MGAMQARGWLRRHPAVDAALPGVVITLVGLAAFAGVLDMVRERDDLSRLDVPVLEWLVAHRGPGATLALALVTLVSGPLVLPAVVAVGSATWVWVRREWWRPVLLVAAMLVSTGVSSGVKGLVGRPRPPVETMDVPGAETTASFPSGHTIGTATLLLVVGYLVWSRQPSRRRLLTWAVVAVLGTALVALSRLYLGYHFLTDVIGAVALAVAVLGLVVAVDRVHGVRARCPQQDSNLQPTD